MLDEYSLVSYIPIRYAVGLCGIVKLTYLHQVGSAKPSFDLVLGNGRCSVHDIESMDRLTRHVDVSIQYGEDEEVQTAPLSAEADEQ